MVNYIRESVVLSKKECTENDSPHFTIAIHHLTEENKLLIIDHVEKVIKKSFKEG